jgi:hypothetical protein
MLERLLRVVPSPTAQVSNQAEGSYEEPFLTKSGRMIPLEVMFMLGGHVVLLEAGWFLNPE